MPQTRQFLKIGLRLTVAKLAMLCQLLELGNVGGYCFVRMADSGVKMKSLDNL